MAKLVLKYRHRLLCGDSTDENDVAKLMDGEKAEFCFTSPPYSDQRAYGGNLELSPSHLAKFLNSPCKLYAVNLGMKRKNNEVDPYWNDYIDAAKSYGHKFLSWNIWNRGVQGSVGQLTAMFPISHEWIFVFGEKAKLNKTIKNKEAGGERKRADRKKDGSFMEKVAKINSHRALGTVLDMPALMARNHGASHPAMFPVELPEKYIEACSNKDDLIYEPFLGSGSTLIACEKTGRRCYGMEIDPHYCSVIIKRFEDYSGEKAVRWVS